MKKCLTIAGSDSGGGAGIQADLKTFAALGVHGSSAIVAITAQNTKTVTAVHSIPLEIIEKQIDAIFDDIGADAVKIGMLSNSFIIQLIAKLLKKYEVKNIVLDPVMVAASGAKLLEDSAIDILKKELIPLATIVTPNIPEAEILSNMKIRDEQGTKAAAEKILGLGCTAVLMKGGHLPSKGQVIDYLFFREDLESFNGFGNNETMNKESKPITQENSIKETMAKKTNEEMTITKNAITLASPIKKQLDIQKSRSKNTEMKIIKITHKKIMKEGHGTGCTLSSAIASYLAKDFALEEAVGKAADYVHNALDRGYKVGERNYVLKHVWHEST